MADDRERLEAKVARLTAALERYGVHDTACPCYPTIPHLPVPEIGNCTCGLGTALSGTGEGRLPPEVREQVREMIDDFDHWQDEHINANPGNVPACLGRDCLGCKLAREKLRAALAALEVK